MRLSVIIPNLHSSILHHVLAALAAQTWPRDRFDVTVVGLDRYGYTARFPFARLLDTGVPTPPARARNLGIQATDGEVVVFLDADAVPRSDWLARYAAWFSTDDVAVVGGGIAFPWDAPYWTVAENVSVFYPTVVTAPRGERPNLPTMNLAVRRAALDRVGLFDERYPKPAGEDTDMTLRLRRAGYTLHFDPAIVVAHRQPRASAPVVLRKAQVLGYYSPRVDPRYTASEGFPPPLRHSWTLRLASPVVAAAATARIYRDNPPLRRRPIWPGVYLHKLAWCWGAARRLASSEHE